jgi:hypothetical protein
VHSQPSGRRGGRFIDVDQLDPAVMHVRVVDACGGVHSHAGILGDEDGTRQPLTLYRNGIEQVEANLFDDSSSGSCDQHCTAGTDREASTEQLSAADRARTTAPSAWRSPIPSVARDIALVSARRAGAATTFNGWCRALSRSPTE